MTAQELNNQLIQHQWTGDPYWNNGEHVIPGKIRYAMVLSLQDPSLAEDRTDAPSWIYFEAKNKVKADERFAHQYDPVPRNKTIKQLMQEYNTRGMKVAARVQLKKRVEFVSFEEQKQVLLAFLDNASVDRKFALKYMDNHWDEVYAPDVVRVWLQYHDQEAAKLIVHHFPDAFILTNREALAVDFNYLQVRLRLPADFPVERERLSDSAYLYLSARQSLEVDDETAERLFYQNMLKAIGWNYVQAPWRLDRNWDREHKPFGEEHSLCDIPIISSMVWSLGMLGKTEILIRFMEFHERIYPIIMQAKWAEVREAFAQLGLALDFSEYDKAVKDEERRLMESFDHPAPEPEQFSIPMSNILFSNVPDDPDAPF